MGALLGIWIVLFVWTLVIRWWHVAAICGGFACATFISILVKDGLLVW